VDMIIIKNGQKCIKLRKDIIKNKEGVHVFNQTFNSNFSGQSEVKFGTHQKSVTYAKYANVVILFTP